MLRTAYVIDERFERHQADSNHPERPQRITAVRQALSDYDRAALVRLEPRVAGDEDILLNHDRALFEAVKATAGADPYAFDSDTHTNADSFDTAMLATGSLLAVVDAIMAGDVDNGFAIVRPPGHHAEADRAMGFCFFNNIAIAARHLIDRHGIKRVLIVDWDVHHGNGTQRSFYAHDEVLFASIHQHPFYPGTGGSAEIGVASGIGYTMNVPCPAGFGDDEYVAVFESLILPAALEFDPQFVLISAGFDCHHKDPLGGMRVTGAGFRDMTRGLLRVANECAQGRAAAVLEGGYSLEALAESVPVVLDELAGRTVSVEAPADHGAGPVIEHVSKVQRRFWKL